MALLDDALDACGGMDRWQRLKRFTIQVSLDGAVFARDRRKGRFKDMVAEGCIAKQSVRFIGFDAPETCASYQPDRVAIERANGDVLQLRGNPRVSLTDHRAWDDLDLVAFCGLAVWSAMTTPFLLAHPGVELAELSPWQQRDEVWRRLRATFPPDLIALAGEQIFYFDAACLLRRTDHGAIDEAGRRLADYAWAHQAFCDITLPTLRRSVLLQPDGTGVAQPPFMDVEIFDAAFE